MFKIFLENVNQYSRLIYNFVYGAKNMKIIIVSAQYIGSISGGGGVHVVELTRELGKLGHEVTVISMGLGRNKNEEEIVLEDTY